VICNDGASRSGRRGTSGLPRGVGEGGRSQEYPCTFEKLPSVH
jgi:hypothetical protein